MSCDGYCEHGEPFNYNETTQEYEYANCCAEGKAMSERKTKGDAELLRSWARHWDGIYAFWESVEGIPSPDDLRRIAERLEKLEAGKWTCECGRNHGVDRCTNCHGEWPDGKKVTA